MSTTKVITRSVRIDSRAHRHIMAAAKYFECTLGQLMMLLLDANLISKLDDSLIPSDLQKKFYDDLEERIDADTYLFKD